MRHLNTDFSPRNDPGNNTEGQDHARHVDSPQPEAKVTLVDGQEQTQEIQQEEQE